MIQPDRILLLNLERRRDRLDAFNRRVAEIANWPFDNRVERQEAVDGKRVPMPTWWTSMSWRHGHGEGAWGNTASWARMMEVSLTRGDESLMVFEDDCIFRDPLTWGDNMRRFLDAVPDDWDAVYVGGNHRSINEFAPVIVNDLVLRCYQVTATHAVIMRKSFMEAVYGNLFNQPPTICDQNMALTMSQKKLRVYAPHRWLCGQAAMGSDIAGGFDHDDYFDLVLHRPPRPKGLDVYQSRFEQKKLGLLTEYP